MFYSVARGDRDARGSGLGLTIVRGMIGAHGGRVAALPGPGGVGTTIRMTLPLPRPATAERRRTSETEDGRGVARRPHPHRRRRAADPQVPRDQPALAGLRRGRGGDRP